MKIAFVGDIAFYGKYSIENENIFDYFKDVSDALKDFDFVIGNLETPLCEECNPYGEKSAHIKSKPENIELLKYLNIGIVNLANNHVFDYGITGYDNTIKILEENGIEYFGIEHKQHRLEKNNQKVALSGFCCYSTNSLGYYSNKIKKGVDILDAFEVEKVLLENEKNGFFNIVSVHAGQEHVNYPNYDHVELARILSDKLPYIYYGHHPHVLQGIEEKNGSLIAYSLGNFCFDDVYIKSSKDPLIKQSKMNKKSIILSVEIENNAIKKYKVISLYQGDNKLEINSDETIYRDIEVYSEYLSLPKMEFIEQRNKKLKEYIDNRKSKRDIQWYLKRLNYRSVAILVNAHRNKKKYQRAIKEYIEQFTTSQF